MKTNAIQSPGFTAGYVFVAQQNYGEKISDIVNDFNKKYEQPLENSNDKVNYFIGAAGAGTRLSGLTSLIGDCNKVCLPFPIAKDEFIHMCDFSLNLGKSLLDQNGYNIMETPVNGNFSGVIQHYRNHPEDKRGVISIGADTAMDISHEKLKEFVDNNIKNNTHLAMIATKKTYLDAANNFGVLDLGEKSDDGSYVMLNFIEKPPIDIAKKYADKNGDCVVNTGLQYISREAIQHILDKLDEDYEKNGKYTVFAKNDKEIYDCAHMISYLRNNYEELFNEDPKAKIKVVMVDDWEDVGIMSGFYRFIDELKDGKFLQNFSDDVRQKTMRSAKSRLTEVDGIKYLNINENNENLTISKVDNINVII